MSPAIHADGLMATRQASDANLAAVGEQLAARRSAGMHDNATVWIAATGQTSRVEGSGAGYRASGAGLIFGVDRTFESMGLVGVALSVEDLRTTASAGTAKGDLVEVQLYGDARRGRAFLDWQADYLRMDQGLNRRPGLPGPSVKAANTLQGGGGQVALGLDLAVRRWTVEPTLELRGQSLSASAARETSGVVLAEEIDSQNNTSLQSFAGVRLSRTLRLASGMPLQVGGQIGWSHEMADTRALATARLADLGGTGFTVGSPSIGRDTAKLGASFSGRLAPNVSVFGAYAAELARDRQAQDVAIGVRARW
jgi:outer membrane autotransporter protein